MSGRTTRKQSHDSGHFARIVQESARRDRRIAKTREALHSALGSLILERPFDAISLQEILDRANVGRSTFYTHFRNKEELLADGIREMLAGVAIEQPARSKAWHDRILRFSLPIFEHHGQHLRTREAKMGARGRAILHDHLERVLTNLIGDELENDPPSALRGSNLPPHLLARYLASTFVLVLNWWTENRKALTARQVDEIFRALVLPALR